MELNGYLVDKLDYSYRGGWEWEGVPPETGVSMNVTPLCWAAAASFCGTSGSTVLLSSRRVPGATLLQSQANGSQCQALPLQRGRQRVGLRTERTTRKNVNRFTVNMCRKVYIEDKITMYATTTNIRIFLTSLSKHSFQTDKLTTKQNVILCVLKELTACGLRSQFRWVAERVDTGQFNKYLIKKKSL